MKNFLLLIPCLLPIILTLIYYGSNDRNTHNLSNSSSYDEMLLNSAEAKGFQAGVINHCLNTKWQDFEDKPYYTYVKTLNSGMRLYRFDDNQTMMEVYVLDGIIKIQSSNFMLNNQTNQMFDEMDAWIRSCKPIDISSSLEIREGESLKTYTYHFQDFEILLSNQGVGIHFMISVKDTGANPDHIRNNNFKQYTNKYISIEFPETWQIIQDEHAVSDQTTVSVQIMEKQKNDYDFSPNISIILSKKKYNQSASYLADISISQSKQLLPSYKFISKQDNVSLGRYSGTKIISEWHYGEYSIRAIQFILKKSDNSTYTITISLDGNKYNQQIPAINNILNTLKFN